MRLTPLLRFPRGKPIRLNQGILFLTYATLHSDGCGEKASRVRQIVEWLGCDFDGAIIFDESHPMQNAAGSKGERGDQEASQQGQARLQLQWVLPDAAGAKILNRVLKHFPVERIGEREAA